VLGLTTYYTEHIRLNFIKGCPLLTRTTQVASSLGAWYATTLMGLTTAVKRIMQEARELANDPCTDYSAAPLEVGLKLGFDLIRAHSPATG
jgi:hypothetical protein